MMSMHHSARAIGGGFIDRSLKRTARESEEDDDGGGEEDDAVTDDGRRRVHG